MSGLLDGFTLVGQECRYISVFRQNVVFSKLVAKELGNPKFVQFFSNIEKQMLAVKGCEEDDINAVAFTPNEEGDVRIYDKDLKDAVEAIYGTESGYRVKGTFHEEEKLHIFDFHDSYEETRRRGRKAKADNTQDDEDAETALDEQPADDQI